MVSSQNCGIKFTEVHGINQGVDPSVKPEKQILKLAKLATESNHQSKPRLGQGRVGLRRNMKTPVQIPPLTQSSRVNPVKEQTLPEQKEVIQPPLTKPTTNRHMPETCIMPDHAIKPKMNAEQILFYPDPLMKSPSRPPDVKKQDNRRMTLDLDLEINRDFEEKSLYQ